MLPRGKFTLNESGTSGVVLLSAGVGITPMISMLHQMVEQSATAGDMRQVWFIHGATNGSTHAFGRELNGIAARYPWLNVHIRYSRPRIDDIELHDYDSIGRIDINLIKELLTTDVFEYYLCGPDSFIDSLHSGLTAAGICDQRIHFEFFEARTAPASRKPATSTAIANHPDTDSPVRVNFARSATSAIWDKSKGSLLDLAEANGVRPPYGCRSGVCQSCLTPVLAGNVGYLESPVRVPDAGQVLLCCAYPLSQPPYNELTLDI
jgi:ferredoxin-NADP reductase